MNAPRRAPRLRSDELLAGRITRLGRFRSIDPRQGRPLPSFSKLLGVLGWAVLLGESFRRSVKASRHGGNVSD